MTQPVYKVLLFLKRRPGLTVEEFRNHYETKHRVLGEKYMTGGLRYVRRYIEPAPGPSGEIEELPYDVISELWVEDRATAEKLVEITVLRQVPDDIRADEEYLFDTSKIRAAMVVEYDSDMAAIKARS